ncbi:MAG: Chaperone SurA [Gemmatimonadaceae bacterium]|nr:Chaperone SurA [Gemmatimonadaceae bacterium]
MLQQMRANAKWIWLFVVASFVGGFLFVETSGLLGREPISTSSVVGAVNGVDIPYVSWLNLSNNLAQQEERQTGKSLTLDERRRVEDQAFDQLVTAILLDQEYKKRKISVTDDEIIQAAQFNPPPELMQNPELQTDGQFDLAKYQRLLKSPASRQQGLLVQLENYYRSEIPRAKLYDQLAGDVYVSDAKLWAVYRDLNDSAQVSFVHFDPSSIPDSTIKVSEAEVRTYYDQNRKRFERPGRAVMTLLAIPRAITTADSATVRNRALALREEILKGAKFEDVAKRESADSVSAADGGSLGRGGKGRFVPEFESAAYALKPGEISQPVATSFGYHLIKIDSRKGDTLSLRHILLRIQQSDSSAMRTDRKADSLVKIAAGTSIPSRLDSAATLLKLAPERAIAVEGQPLFAAGRVVPSVSAWAFGGARVGDISDMFDSDEAYFVARLDTLSEGGIAPLADVKDQIVATLTQRKKAELILPQAQAFASEAARTSLDAAAKAKDLTVTKSPSFARPGFVPGLGRLNAPIGAAFSLPVGAVSEPIVADEGVFVIRVDRRVEADSAAWVVQKSDQRKQAMNSLREARIRNYIEGVRKQANIKDKRKELNASAREQAAATVQ